jgi:hypothetical protein
MKPVIAGTSFLAGAIGTLLALGWFAVILLSRHAVWPFPSDILSIEGIFAAWATIMFGTFYRSPKPIWVPVLAVTSERVKRARLILACAVVNVAIWLLALVGFLVLRLSQPLPWIFCLFASSCAVLNSSYVLIHWALRPENLFSDQFRRFADDPLVFALVRAFVRIRHMRMNG